MTIRRAVVGDVPALVELRALMFEAMNFSGVFICAGFDDGTVEGQPVHDRGRAVLVDAGARILRAVRRCFRGD